MYEILDEMILYSNVVWMMIMMEFQLSNMKNGHFLKENLSHIFYFDDTVLQFTVQTFFFLRR